MAVSEEQFGIEISRLLKERKLTQCGLAKHLGITSPAVCYLLKNRLHASAAQFDGIMEFLQADALQISSLRRLWRATQKDLCDRKDTMENLFSIRCAKGVSLEEVSASTGISVERLKFLENKADAAPTAEEEKRLKGYYGTDPEGLGENLGEENLQDLGVAEEFADEMQRSDKSLPVFSTDVLSRAAKAGSLEKFLGGLPFNNAVFSISPQHMQRAKAVLICDADEIHYGFEGTLQLVLADYDPASTDPLHLGRGGKGGFALWQKMRRAWKYYGAEHPAPRMANAWSLPVLEMHFIASPRIKVTSGKKD